MLQEPIKKISKMHITDQEFTKACQLVYKIARNGKIRYNISLRKKGKRKHMPIMNSRILTQAIHCHRSHKAVDLACSA